MSNLIEVKVPDIGDFKDVEVIELMVKPGDVVALEQSLITVESDKASMEIPSSAAGVVAELKVKVGDKVNEGSLLLMLQATTAAQPAGQPVAGSAVAAAPAVAPPVVAAPAVVPATVPVPAPGSSPPILPVAEDLVVKPHASPSVRKFARELGVDLYQVRGTGPKQRITQADVQAYVKNAVAIATSAPAAAAAQPKGGGTGLNLLAWPSLDFSKHGPTHLLPLSRVKKISGPNLARNWAMIPHVTQFDEADITELEEFRKSSNEAIAKSGVKLTMLAFVIKACVSSLKQFPAVNSSLDAAGENLILKDYWNIGFAADTPNGLVVPVLKNADQKGIIQIAKEMGELSAKARDGKLGPSEMTGATFTISSLGGIGGTAFTPIVNAPEVAILGLSRSELKPKWDGKQFVPRLMMPLSFSYDHRVIDGAQGARFTVHLAGVLADMRKVLL